MNNDNHCFLSIESIIEASGEEHLEDVKNLEILFNACQEIDSLEYTPNLSRLTMINNGLTMISNLYPIQETLTYLCLCDQQIYRMENLYLPSLQYLYLHRNHINHIEGLEHCPQLKILWLSQNKINSISGLESCQCLEELQLHSNQITHLNGIETLQSSLVVLGISDNLINTFDEIDFLSRSMHVLREISFHDIHFGSCPVYDLDGYREYTILSLPQLTSLDGIQITPTRAAAAQRTMQTYINAIQVQIDKVDADYAKEMAAVQAQESFEIAQCNEIEESRRAEILELAQKLAAYSLTITEQITQQEQLFDRALAQFNSQVDQLFENACDAVQTQVLQPRNDDILLRLELKLERKSDQFLRVLSGSESIESLSSNINTVSSRSSNRHSDSTASTLRNLLRVTTPVMSSSPSSSDKNYVSLKQSRSKNTHAQNASSARLYP